MTLLNVYATREVLRSRLGLTDTADDAILDRALSGVSRKIDEHCGRHFFIKTATYAFTPRSEGRILLPYDLIAVTSFKTDPARDFSYSDTWATTDYVLLPSGAPKGHYYDIRPAPNGAFGFAPQLLYVQIVGRWGYKETLMRATSLLAGAIATTTATTVAVDDGSEFGTGLTIKVDDEQMAVQAISGDTLAVLRGVNGTTAATHLDNAPIDVYIYPDDLAEACILQAQHHYHNKDALMGVIGGGEFGPVRVSALSAIARDMLQTFVYDEMS